MAHKTSTIKQAIFGLSTGEMLSRLTPEQIGKVISRIPSSAMDSVLSHVSPETWSKITSRIPPEMFGKIVSRMPDKDISGIVNRYMSNPENIRNIMSHISDESLSGVINRYLGNPDNLNRLTKSIGFNPGGGGFGFAAAGKGLRQAGNWWWDQTKQFTNMLGGSLLGQDNYNKLFGANKAIAPSAKSPLSAVATHGQH